jgi:hypothetical protein
MKISEFDLVQIAGASVMIDFNLRGNGQQIVVILDCDVVIVDADGSRMDARRFRHIVGHQGDSAHAPGCTIDKYLTMARDKGRLIPAHIKN